MEQKRRKERQSTVGHVLFDLGKVSGVIEIYP